MAITPGESTLHPIRSIELFTGAGGLARALEEAGNAEHLMAVELDRRACDTLRLNGAVDVEALPGTSAVRGGSGWPLVERDVREVSFEEFCGRTDLVAGGVPCQPWSLGGAHKGFDDARNLWPELFRTVRESRPKAVIAENVKGLLRPSFKEYYEYILSALRAPFLEPQVGEAWRDHRDRLVQALSSNAIPADERYSVQFKLLNAADYGVPQQRWRVFVVAFRSDLGIDGWTFPSPTHSEGVLHRAQLNGEYWSSHGLQKRPPVVRPTESGESSELAPWRTLRDALVGLPEPLGHRIEHPDWANHVGWKGAKIYPGHTPNHLDKPAKTVKAGVHGVPGGESVVALDNGDIRYLTARETARIMSFPDEWKFAGPRGEQMRQLGNAVPVLLGRAVASSVFAALESVVDPADADRRDAVYAS